MREITYTCGKEKGAIYWVSAEQFKEIEGQRFNMSEMEATQIEQIENLSITAKILLSAVAGATIQHMIDNGIKTEEIFSNGSFTIKLG